MFHSFHGMIKKNGNHIFETTKQTTNRVLTQPFATRNNSGRRIPIRRNGLIDALKSILRDAMFAIWSKLLAIKTKRFVFLRNNSVFNSTFGRNEDILFFVDKEKTGFSEALETCIYTTRKQNLLSTCDTVCVPKVLQRKHPNLPFWLTIGHGLFFLPGEGRRLKADLSGFWWSLVRCGGTRLNRYDSSKQV